ncbi:MAG: GTP 3',8-cyclase MoaA [Planctomycetota bacterium]|nr:GTP 3',8-cyclase MoaA [Planctomycetota bacterium]
MGEEKTKIEPPVDRFGRTVTHLRVSVTERCNLNCPYCHREGVPVSGSARLSEETSEGFRKIFNAASRLGICESIKFTGGEPLLRKDLEEIIGAAKEANFQDISLTTNGTLLDEKRAVSLKNAGLSRMNIGCDAISSSVVPKSYERVKSALEAASSAKIAPLKINMVLLKGINESDVWRMLDVARSYNATLQLIELVSVGDEPFFKKHYFSLAELEREVEKVAVSKRLRTLQGRTVYHLSDGEVVEFVRSVHNPRFCASCKKLRITADGGIKTCLLREERIQFSGEVSILKAISLRRPYYG